MIFKENQSTKHVVKSICNTMQWSHRTYPNTGTTQTKGQSELSSFGLLPGSGFDNTPFSDLVHFLSLILGLMTYTTQP
jgi:hypothetical protein